MTAIAYFSLVYNIKYYYIALWWPLNDVIEIYLPYCGEKMWMWLCMLCIGGCYSSLRILTFLISLYHQKRSGNFMRFKMEALKTRCINSWFDYSTMKLCIFICKSIEIASHTYTKAKTKIIYLYLEMFLLEYGWEYDVYAIVHLQNHKTFARC